MSKSARTLPFASLLVAGLAFGYTGAATAGEPAGHDGLLATYWLQNAVEAKANHYALYALAKLRLDQALADKSWTAALEQGDNYENKPPAVILDIDETVLDNSPYQAWVVEKDKYYSSKTWAPFVETRTSREIPGSLDFTKYAASKGVAVIYLSNRKAPLEKATRDNLAKFGYPVDQSEDVVLLRGEKDAWKSSGKAPRHAHVTAKYRVLLLLGDNLGDFTDEKKGTPADRAKVYAKHQARWGHDWIMFANPTYGSWYASAINSQWRAKSSEKRMMMYKIMYDWGGVK